MYAAGVAVFAHRALSTFESVSKGTIPSNVHKLSPHENNTVASSHSAKTQQPGVEEHEAECEFEFGACLAALRQLSKRKRAAKSPGAVEKLFYRSICMGLQFKRSCEVVKVFEMLVNRIAEAVALTASASLAVAAGATVNGCRALVESFELTKRTKYLRELVFQAERAATWIHRLSSIPECESRADDYMNRLSAILHRGSVGGASDYSGEDTANAMLECAKCVIQCKFSDKAPKSGAFAPSECVSDASGAAFL